MEDIIEIYNNYHNSQTDDNLQAFYNILAISTFLIPFKIVNGSENLITLQDKNRTKYFPIFTDFNAVSRGISTTIDDEIKFAEVTSKEIHEILKSNSTINAIVLNPYDINVVLNKKVIQLLYSINDSAKELYGNSTKNTTVFEKNLSAIFDSFPEIKRAYFTKMLLKEELSYLVVLEYFEQSNKEIFEKISDTIVKQEIIFDLPLDMISADTKLGKDIMLSQKPFYIKNSNE